jgi:signal transduction histidine kinase
MNLRSFLNSAITIKILFLLSILMLFYISNVTYKHTKALNESTKLLVHSYQIQYQLEHLLSMLKDAETGQRGYIITRNNTYLKPYRSAQDEVYKSYIRLKALTLENPQQQANLEELLQLIYARLKYMAMSLESIALKTESKEQMNENMLAGKEVMDGIRNQINKMEDLEISYFNAHQEKYNQEVIFSPISTYLFAIFSLVIFILSFFKINKDIGTLHQSNSVLEEQNRKLEQSIKELESFNRVASHDLQEPLRKIQTFISRIRETDKVKMSDQGQDYLSKVDSSAQKMRVLIDDLLLYSRTNKSEKSFEKADLNQLLENATQELIHEIEEKKAVIQAGQLPVLKVIDFQIQQLFTNLIGNALKYSKPDVAPLISIKSERLSPGKYPGFLSRTYKHYYRITVADNGLGFEQEYAEKIFVLFHRLHQEAKYAGTGIGLSICKKIAENHNGYIIAEGQPDIGATFTIYLPS